MSARRAAAVLLAAAAALSAGPAWAQLEVKQVDWGFGGKVVPGRFAPVSILLDNPADQPFDGVVRLTRVGALGGQRKGAALEEPVFLSQFTRRRVQFYVLPSDGLDPWQLEAIPAGGAEGEGLSTTLRKPGFADDAPPVVVLLPAGDEFTRVPEVARMTEDLFPPRPEATEGLGGVVLDHAPDWEDVRQTSFLTWLRGGGSVHLLNDRDGKRPRFGGLLTGLNDPADTFPVGRGVVVRHDRTLRGVTKEYAEDRLLPDPRAVRMNAEDLAFEDRRKKQGGALLSFSPNRLEDEILPTLRRMVRPEHSWGLIHILCLAYVVALFPGVFLVGRERRGYPVTLGLLLAVTVAFGASLRAVGRRGYGESKSVRTTALVKALPPAGAAGEGTTEVTQWADAFVTDGGDYTFAVRGEAALYSTGSEEAVKGTIDNGTGANGAAGSLTADVPPYSSRAFVAKAVRAEPAPAVRLLGAAEGRTDDNRGVRLSGLRVEVPEELRGRGRLFAVHRRHVYPLFVSDGVAAPQSGQKPIALADLLSGYGTGLVGNITVQDAPYGDGMGYGYDPYQTYGWEEDEELTDRGLDSAARQLIGRDLGFLQSSRAYRLAAPDGRVRVYAVVPLREEHHVLGAEGRAEDGVVPTEPLPNQNGTTIFSYDFPL